MKKSELKSGMKVKCDNGIYTVVLGTDGGDLFLNEKGFSCMDDYNEDLTSKRYSVNGWDITEVFDHKWLSEFISNYNIGESLWKREEKVALVIGEWYSFNYGLAVSVETYAMYKGSEYENIFNFTGIFYGGDKLCTRTVTGNNSRNFKLLSEDEVSTMLIEKCESMGYKSGSIVKTAKDKKIRTLKGGLKFDRTFNGLNYIVYANTDIDRRDVALFTIEHGFATIGSFCAE